MEEVTGGDDVRAATVSCVTLVTPFTRAIGNRAGGPR